MAVKVTPFALLTPYRLAIVMLLTLVGISAAAEAAGLVLISALLATFVPTASAGDGMFAGVHGAARANPTTFLAITGAIYISKSLLSLGVTYFAFSLGLHMADDWSLRVLRGYLSAPLRRLSRQQGSMLHMLLSEPALVGGGLATGGLLAQNALSAVSVYGALLMLSPVLTLGLTVMAAAAVAAVLLLSRFAQSVAIRRTQVADDAYAYITETLGSLKQLRLFGLEEAATTRVARHLTRARALQRTTSVVSSSPRLIIETIFLIGLAFLVAVVTPAVSGGLALADAGLVVAAAFRLLPNLSATAGTWVQLQQALPGLKRIADEIEFLEATPSLSSVRAGRRAPSFKDRIVVDGVSFAYPAREQALDAIDIVVPHGGFVAIVGPSGSGKSTLVDLLCGFYEPDAGRVLVDGVDLREIDGSAWRRKLGVVPQDTFLFSGTLCENLLILRPDADEAELRRVVEVVGAEQFVAELPDGYATRVGERGLRLSGGQRQRLALARVLLKRPEILILDEATSGLDVTSDEALQARIAALRGSTTMIVIAHRLSSVRAADRIYVLSRGRVVEEGPHEDLLRRNGVYASMWRATTHPEGTHRA